MNGGFGGQCTKCCEEQRMEAVEPKPSEFRNMVDEEHQSLGGSTLRIGPEAGAFGPALVPKGSQGIL